MTKTVLRRIGQLACGWLLVAAAAHAEYPDKPIKLMVPYAPGIVDAVARVIAQGMSDHLKTPLVVENMAGAAGATGTGRVVSAAPDGYNVLYASSAIIAQNPVVYKLPYDPMKDLTPVSYALNSGLFLFVNKSLGVNTLQELVAKAKASPGSLTYGTSGNASFGHVTGELFKKRAGVDIRHIPYKSSTATLTDLLGGRISMFFYPYSGAEQHVKAGNLVALAYTGKQRLPAAPNIPTFAESGFPGFDQTFWYGFFVPAGTPKPVVAKLNAAVHHGLKEEALKKYYDVVPMPSTPEEFAETVRKDSEALPRLLKELDIKIE
jgi:tripartite-type tricarboxylate transporter receptor subunit TctC